MERKSLKDISWLVTEEEYRKDHSLSYSTLAKFEREGFNNLSSLYDRVESPSLTHGSAVDSIITGGNKEFEERFFVAEFPKCPDKIIQVVKELFNIYHNKYDNINEIPDKAIISTASEFNYQNNWKPETRAKVIKENGVEYYNLLFIANGREILGTQEYQDVINSVKALKESRSTSWYFASDNPFEPVERLYQLKFKAVFNNIHYRCMADLIIVNYDEKTIQPVDLKTSSHTEWDFFKSFVDWRYDIQARLYWKIIRDNMNRDPFFKDFKLLDYKFIVVNKRTLVPLVWSCPFTQCEGTLTFGKNNQIVMRSPLEIGEELSYYLSSGPKVPNGIDEVNDNDLKKWLNTL